MMMIAEVGLVDVDDPSSSSFQQVVVVVMEASSYLDEVAFPAYWDVVVLASSSFLGGDEDEGASSFQGGEASFVVEWVASYSYSVVASHPEGREGGTWDWVVVPLFLICQVCSWMDEVVVVVVVWD